MATVESNTNTGMTTVSSGSPDLTITKPTGLVAGDHLVAFCCGYHTGAFSVSYATPSGWTLIEDSGSVSSTWRMYTFYKEADSGDASASDFDFTASTAGTNPAAGALFRVSGFGIVDDSNTANSQTITSAMSYTRADSLNFFAAVVRGGTPSISSYAYATDDPTWTEAFDVGSSTDAFAVAYATRAATTDTGNATYSDTGSSGRAATVIAIAPEINGSKEGDIPALVSYVGQPMPRLAIASDIEGPDASGFTPTQWTTTTKS